MSTPPASIAGYSPPSTATTPTYTPTCTPPSTSPYSSAVCGSTVAPQQPAQAVPSVPPRLLAPAPLQPPSLFSFEPINPVPARPAGVTVEPAAAAQCSAASGRPATTTTPKSQRPQVPFDPPEPVTKHIYDRLTGKWTAVDGWVQVQPTNFCAGGMRLAFRVRDLSFPQGEQQECVAKLSGNPTDPKCVYFRQAEMQHQCGQLADQYNNAKPPPPTKIEIIPAWVVEFKKRAHPNGKPGEKLAMLCEPFLRGHYQKHNNNMGYVNTKRCRRTPHAFSHFTHHWSKGRLIVVDIQGVGDRYTDPQIHSDTDEGLVYGPGDLGREGILLFFASHQCNSICAQLGLPVMRVRPVVLCRDTPPTGYQIRQQTAEERQTEDAEEKKYPGSRAKRPALPVEADSNLPVIQITGRSSRIKSAKRDPALTANLLEIGKRIQKLTEAADTFDGFSSQFMFGAPMTPSISPPLRYTPSPGPCTSNPSSNPGSHPGSNNSSGVKQ